MQVSEKEIPSASLIRSARPRTLRSRGLSTTAVIWTARDDLSRAKALAAAYDASPSHSAENVRFYEGMETVGIYSDFSRSALDAALHAFLDDGGTSEHESFWESVT